MTQNHQCVCNQKIQTACPYSRANRLVGQAVFFASSRRFFASNGWMDRAIYCKDKGRFSAISFAVSGF